jgi:creatinine amidohydrolase
MKERTIMTSKPLYTVTGPKTMFEMTWEEVQEVLTQTDTVLLPVGALEQHGPHLPLGSDSMQGIEMCKRVQLLLAEEGTPVVVGPPFIYGLSAAHMEFPGTITLQPHTMLMVLEETCLSLYRHGFRKFALIMGHGGNWPIMQVAAQSVVAQTQDADVIALNWLELMYAEYPRLLASKRTERHSGEGETARMLATHPELVELGRARTYYAETLTAKESITHPSGIYRPKRSMKASSPIGSIGDPKLATAETGEKIYDVIVRWLADAIKHEFAS